MNGNPKEMDSALISWFYIRKLRIGNSKFQNKMYYYINALNIIVSIIIMIHVIVPEIH